MLQIKLIAVHSPAYKQVLQLRDKILRHPLGLQLSKADTANDANEIIIAAFDDEQVVGCVQLHPIDAQTIKLRQMAVDYNRQRQGIGTKLVRYAEQVAQNKQYSSISLHARKSALEFYKKLDYQVYSSLFMEVGIPHFEMVKMLNRN